MKKTSGNIAGGESFFSGNFKVWKVYFIKRLSKGAFHGYFQLSVCRSFKKQKNVHNEATPQSSLTVNDRFYWWVIHFVSLKQWRPFIKVAPSSSVLNWFCKKRILNQLSCFRYAALKVHAERIKLFRQPNLKMDDDVAFC